MKNSNPSQKIKYLLAIFVRKLNLNRIRLID